MAQGDYIELHRKRHGRKLDHEERKRKKEARSGHKRSAIAKTVRGRASQSGHSARVSGQRASAAPEKWGGGKARAPRVGPDAQV